MFQPALLLAAVVLAGPLEETFRPLLEPEQVADTAEEMAAAMRPDQKEKGRAVLSASQLPAEEKARGFRLLEAPLEAYRAEAEARGLLPTPAGELTAQASDALARGDHEAAARFAAEALARDPKNAAAFGVLKLTERRVPAEAPVIQAAALGMPPAAAVVAPPNAAARARMKEAVAARAAGDLDAVQQAALSAMRADPTSPEVQELYRLVAADRAKAQARVQGALSLMEQARDAQNSGQPEEAERLARQAAELDPDSIGYWEKLRRILEERAKNTPPPAKSRAPKPRNEDPLPPLFPIAGSLMLAAGAFAWARWGREKADTFKRDAAIILVAGGAAAVAYGAWMALPMMLSGGPTLAPAAGPALTGAAVGSKTAAAGGAIAIGVTASVVADAALPAAPQYSYATIEEQHRELPGESEGWTKLKGDQGWRDRQGNIWKKDTLHKDHWDVSDRKGNKIKEIDFEGRQIWPNGPKNKNKRP